MARHSLRSSLITLALAGGLYGALATPAAFADGSNGPVGMPTQATTDGSSSDPGSPGPGWGDMAGGVAARPYVVSLTVINGGVSTPVITNGTTTATPVSPGAVTTVVLPLNLCAAGQPPAPGSCYATPNRVGVTVVYGQGNTDGWDFSNPSQPVTPSIDSNSVIDMTVALNTLGKSLRWTWINGELLYWQTHNLGQDDATVHIKFRPATAPFVASFPPGNGCTASPPLNCEIPRADANVLSAEVLFSLDNTLDPSLTGAVFATQNAITGYLTPGGTPQAPSLDIQLASTHQRADGTPQLGTLQAFLPAAALLNLYGVLPADAASEFTTTRLGDPGTNDPASYTPWTAAANGSEGLLVAVSGITFSVPNYQISGRLGRAATRAKIRRVKTIVIASVRGCSKRRPCVASIYDLGRSSSPRFLARMTAVVTHELTTSQLRLAAPASKLRRGDRYLLVVRAARTRKVLMSSLGIVG